MNSGIVPPEKRNHSLNESKWSFIPWKPIFHIDQRYTLYFTRYFNSSSIGDYFSKMIFKIISLSRLYIHRIYKTILQLQWNILIPNITYKSRFKRYTFNPKAYNISKYFIHRLRILLPFHFLLNWKGYDTSHFNSSSQ